MKIALFTSTFLPRIGGTEVVVHNLATELCRRGDQAHVFTWWGLWRDLDTALTYPVHPFFPKSFEIWRALWKFPSFADSIAIPQICYWQKKYGFDLWHVHMGFPAAPFIVPALKRLNIPVVVTCHGDDVQTLPGINYGMRLNPLFDRMITRSLLMANRLTSISDSMTQDYRDMGLMNVGIDLVPNGVHAERIRKFEVDRNQVRRDLGIDEKTKVILTVGRNDRRKGFALIPEALKDILQSHPDVIWLLVGRQTAEIAPLAKKAGVQDKLRILDNIDILDDNEDDGFCVTPARALLRLLKAADVFAFPSLIEGFGIVLIEAMAAGLPIVSTNAPGCRDVVKHGKTGMLAKPGNAHAMADEISELLHHPEKMKQLGDAAKEESKKYEWNMVCDSYCRVYSMIIDAKSNLRLNTNYLDNVSDDDSPSPQSSSQSSYSPDND